MRTLNTIVLMGAMTAAAGAMIADQVKTIPDETITTTATIEAIEPAIRTLTIKNHDGTYDSIVVPADVERFSELKLGDKITVRYYSSLIVRLKPAGEAATDTDTTAVTPTAGQKPGGTAASQRTVTATVVAIDPSVPSITVKGPNGWTYSRRVTDKKALAKVKVGDRLDITWNDAVLISVTPAK